MATEVLRRRGSTVEHATFTGAAGELTVDTTKNTVVVHDGSTAGGVPLATEAAVSAITTELLEDTTPQLGGDLQTNGNEIIFGTGDSIRGDFSNGTVNDRTAVQTSSANGSTALHVKPNGTGAAAFLILQDDQDWTNCNFAILGMTGGIVQLSSRAQGTGTPGDLELQIGSHTAFKIDTNYALHVGDTNNYEALVTNNDHIPNKKYVDDEIAANSSSYTQPTSLGGVGTYAMLRYGSNFTAAVSAGALISSQLSYSNSSGNTTTAASGTWRCMGRIAGSTSDAVNRTTVWLRIA